MKSSDDVERLAALAEQSDSPNGLLGEMVGLRKDLVRTRRKNLRDRVIFFVFMLAFVVLFVGQANTNDRQQDQTNQILAGRTQARVGLCKNLETFATGHDRFVEQVIQERRDIIAATLANPNTSEAQKQASVEFFQAQIEAYKANIVPTYDCSDPAVVADIFKP